jgi:cephalosporin hydroxylase
MKTYSKEDFKKISKQWLRAGWDTKHVYSFTWLGRPIIQLPEDMIRIQELIYQIKPDVIIETGIAHGGSLIYYASLCDMIDNGRVIGIDIDIRKKNKKAIMEHKYFMQGYITMFQGSSIDETILKKVKNEIKSYEPNVMVILDSSHKKAHVLAELEAYSDFVSVGSYIIACDGIAKEVAGAPRTTEDWKWDNPKDAVKEFLKNNDDFVCEYPKFLFNEGEVTEPVTYWQNGFLRRVK